MPGSRFHNVDITTPEGQAEILSAWSRAVLGSLEAASILKLTQIEFLALASNEGFSLPTAELVEIRSAELEAHFRPLARNSERKRVQDHLEDTIVQLNEDVWRLKHTIEWSAALELQRSRLLSEQAVLMIEMASSEIASAVALLVDAGVADEMSGPAKGDS